MKDFKKLSILIVDYFKCDRVISSVDSLSHILDGVVQFEFIILDNSNDKKNREALLKGIGHLDFVKLIFSEVNVGYTKAMNIIAREATGDVLLVLNPDIVIDSVETVSSCLSFLKSNVEVGIVAPFQINVDGTFPEVARKYPSFLQLIVKRTFYKMGLFCNYVKSYTEPYDLKQEIIYADWLQSSCFFIEKNVYDEIGGFDEKYFLFMADIDFCKQLSRIGMKSVYLKTPYVFADGKRASDGGVLSLFKSKALRIHIADAIKYYV